MKIVALIALLAAPLAPQEPSKPGKEHEALKVFEGEWSFQGKFFMDPAQPPMEMNGAASSKLVLGGFYLNSDVKSTFGGAAFEGRWTMTFSAFKKKYQASWIDSMMPHVFVSEGDLDAAGKTYTFSGESFDPATGKPIREKWVMEVKDADNHTMTFYGPGPDGKERKTGEIVYKKKK
jgi:uncharacterized protein DUF1579